MRVIPSLWMTRAVGCKILTSEKVMRTVLVLFVLLSGLLCNRAKAEAVEADSSAVAIEFVRFHFGQYVTARLPDG